MNHGDLVQDLNPSEFSRSSSVKEEHRKSMREARVELGDLPHSDIALEWVLQTEACPKVVRVHDHMCQRVNPSPIAYCSTANTRKEEHTPDRHNGPMVIDMQEGELSTFFVQYNP